MSSCDLILLLLHTPLLLVVLECTKFLNERLKTALLHQQLGVLGHQVGPVLVDALTDDLVIQTVVLVGGTLQVLHVSLVLGQALLEVRAGFLDLLTDSRQILYEIKLT